MTRRRSNKANRRSAPRMAVEVTAEIRRAPPVPTVDEPDADLPGCFVEQAQVECGDFWREWRRVQRIAAHRVPVLLMRRRRSRLLLVIAAEDLPCLVAAIRMVQERPD